MDELSMDEQAKEFVRVALGILPSGRYLMTAGHDGQRGGMIVRSVQCCGNDPALICVAAPKGHKIDPLIRDSRSFAIGVIDPDDKLVARRFASTDAAPTENPDLGDDDPFDAIETRTLMTGAPILTRCRTWFDCEVMRRVDLEAQTELFVGVVVSIWHNGEQVTIDQISESESSD